MNQESLILTEKAGGIAWIILNRPSAMNSLTLAMMAEIKRAIIAADKDQDVGVIVITGIGRAFCTGLDLKALGDIDFKGGRIEPEYDDIGNDLINAIQSASKIVIAMVNGFCFAGGLEIMLSFDLIVAADNVIFGDTHAKFGLRPSFGLSQRLTRLVGLNKAKEWSFTAQHFTAQEAKEAGLVNIVVPADKLREEVTTLAEKILKNSLETVAAIKSLYNQGWQTTLNEGLEIEAKSYFEINDTNDRLKDFIEKQG